MARNKVKHTTFWASHMENKCVNTHFRVKNCPSLQEVSAV
jgi:hypothetical protein